jgi:hypothetical protein
VHIKRGKGIAQLLIAAPYLDLDNLPINSSYWKIIIPKLVITLLMSLIVE